MNVEALEEILRVQKEKYGDEWAKLWAETEPKLKSLRELMLADDKKLTKYEVKTQKDNMPKEIKNIFKNILPATKHINKFFESNKLKQLLKKLYEVNDFETCCNLFIEALKSKDIPGQIASISAWWAVFKPNMFMPIWCNWEGRRDVKGTTINKRVAEKAKINQKKLWDDIEYIYNFIKTIKTVAQRVGINNMIEVAYYLSKYGEEHPEDGETSMPSINLNEYFQSKGYNFPDHLTAQFYTALKTKGFVILSGLSGTGKTKMALEFAKLLSKDEKCYEFLSVQPDWRDSKKLLGYYNPLNGKYYETPLLKLILRAIKDYEQNGENAMPYFIILDEMNLAHVEYYFADFLSVLESGRDENGFTRESVKLHNSDEVQGLPKEIKLPPNIYVIGTVNIDETTYMFSPKVLDRAFTIEFHDVDLDGYSKIERGNLDSSSLRDVILDDLKGFLNYADKGAIRDAIRELPPQYWKILKELNEKLEPYELHFGYRVIDEIALFFKNAKKSWERKIVHFESEDDIFDLAILMKILPKFHGNRKKLERPIKEVLRICLKESFDVDSLTTDKIIELLKNWNEEKQKFRFYHTAKKSLRMLRQLYEVGFSSFS